MKLAIMQPYLFPYIGYFQLMQVVDAFLILDEVAHIRRGWINRNRLKCGDEVQAFTVPVQKGPVGQPIRETLIAMPEYAAWRRKFFRLLHQHYGRAPHREATFVMLERLLPDSREGSIGELAQDSLRAVHAHLGLTSRILPSGTAQDGDPARGQDRIIGLCQQLGASTYVNLPGGAALYSREVMARAGIELRFLLPRFDPYPQQGRGPFQPGLSILDVLMNNPVEDIHRLLGAYALS